jgi:hypothetical protein
VKRFTNRAPARGRAVDDIDHTISTDDTISAAFEFVDADCRYDIGGHQIVSATAHFSFKSSREQARFDRTAVLFDNLP